MLQVGRTGSEGSFPMLGRLVRPFSVNVESRGLLGEDDPSGRKRRLELRCSSKDFLDSLRVVSNFSLVGLPLDSFPLPSSFYSSLHRSLALPAPKSNRWF